MQTYVTLEGQVLDLSDLPEEQQRFFDRCVAAFREGQDWTAYCQMIEGLENPLLRPTGRVVTWAILNTPLFQTMTHIENRLGIQQEMVGADPGDDVERDPLADEWLSVEEAARRKGVTVQGLRRGIAAGRVIAHAAPGEEGRLLVSANSLGRWTPRNRRPAADPKRAVARRAS